MGKGKKKKDPLDLYKNYEIVENAGRKTESCPVVFFVTHLFKCTCKSERNHWESPLKDAKNGEICYGCDKTVMPYQQISGPTPFKGEKRVFGVFRCHKCLRTWESANSWAGISQKCEVCEIQIFPFDQDNLKFKGIKNREKGHQNGYCEMCLKINGDCSKLDVNPFAKSHGPRSSRSRRRNRASKKKVTDEISTSAPGSNTITNNSPYAISTSKTADKITAAHPEQMAQSKTKRKSRRRNRNRKTGQTLTDQHVNAGNENAIIDAVKSLLIR